MEAPVLLVAVQRIVGGVEIEDDLPRGLRVRVEEQIDEQALDGFGVTTLTGDNSLTSLKYTDIIAGADTVAGGGTVA